MSQPQNNQDKDLEKIDQDINFHRIIIFLIILSVIAFYLIMKEITVTEAAQHWGPVGDFFGGILNPIFALFAFYWLTYSVRLQIKELKETRQELKKAAQAQEESAKHQEEIARLEAENVSTQQRILEAQEQTLVTQLSAAQAQQEQIILQNFENLFFELLKSKSNMLSDIKYSDNMFDEESNNSSSFVYYGKDAFKKGIESYKKNFTSDYWVNYFDNYLIPHWSNYFNLCFHIMKIIHANKDIRKIGPRNTLYSAKQKEYFDIFKVTLSQFECEAFFFILLYDLRLGPVKRLVEKYCLFSVMQIDSNILGDFNNFLTSKAYMYEKRAFSDNKSWSIYFEEIEIINKNMKIKDLRRIIKKLMKVGYIEKKYSHMSSKIKFDEIGNYKLCSRRDLYKKGEILTCFNKKFLMDGYFTPYRTIVREVGECKKIIKNSRFNINLAKSACFSENKKLDINRRYLGFGGDIFVPKDIYYVVNEKRKEIRELRYKLREIETILEEIESDEFFETVLILLKYKIDYSDFLEFYNAKEE